MRRKKKHLKKCCFGGVHSNGLSLVRESKIERQRTTSVVLYDVMCIVVLVVVVVVVIS